jgi:hypothetical protein
MVSVAPSLNKSFFVQCLKFKTNQAQDVQKVEKLNSFFVRLMSCKTVDASTAAAITAAIEQGDEFLTDLNWFGFQIKFDRSLLNRGGTICSTTAVVTAIEEGRQKKIISFFHILCYQTSRFHFILLFGQRVQHPGITMHYSERVA